MVLRTEQHQYTPTPALMEGLYTFLYTFLSAKETYQRSHRAARV